MMEINSYLIDAHVLKVGPKGKDTVVVFTEEYHAATVAELESKLKVAFLEGVVLGERRGSGYMHEHEAQKDARNLWREWFNSGKALKSTMPWEGVGHDWIY